MASSSGRRRALVVIAASACLALLAMHASSRASALVQKQAKRAHAGKKKMPAWANAASFDSTKRQAPLTAVGKAQHEFFWEGLGDEQDRAILHAPHKKVGALKAVQTQMLFEQPARPFYEASYMGQGGDWAKYGKQLDAANGGNPYAEGWAKMKPAKNMDQLYGEIDQQLEPLAEVPKP
ncbi:hypothetical protein T484DRAFT_1773345 [Baffinella frigidus]|nr:hypothetical protein T484DRAFT_1773345 [Cryptophyta sp. CCMP2293]